MKKSISETKPVAVANNSQVGGDHYSSYAYQHWDFTADVLAGRYMEGQITKYVSRARKKNGLQDLEKARHFLVKLGEQVETGTPAFDTSLEDKSGIARFCAANELTDLEAAIISTVSTWKTSHDLSFALRMLSLLMEFKC